MYYRNIKLTIIAINIITCRLNMIKIDKDIRLSKKEISQISIKLKNMFKIYTEKYYYISSKIGFDRFFNKNSFPYLYKSIL